MRILRLIVVGSIMGVGASVFIKLSSASTTSCSVFYRNDSTITTAAGSIVAEVAKTDSQRATGLGGRACIGADQGMLFEFNSPGLYPFWMKDMKFPIDIVWISSDHQVVTVKPNITPSTYPQNFVSTAKAQYVLELQANRAQTLGITPGAILQFNP